MSLCEEPNTHALELQLEPNSNSPHVESEEQTRQQATQVTELGCECLCAKCGPSRACSASLYWVLSE